jgi:cation transport regulator ChaB
MQYGKIEELPKDVREYLSEQNQYQFLTAFNAFVRRGCDQGSAFQLAWQSLGQQVSY